MALKLRTVVKAVVEAVLFMLLAKYLGLTAWYRFPAEKVVLTSAKEDQGFVPALTITACDILVYRTGVSALPICPIS